MQTAMVHCAAGRRGVAARLTRALSLCALLCSGCSEEPVDLTDAPTAAAMKVVNNRPSPAFSATPPPQRDSSPVIVHLPSKATGWGRLDSVAFGKTNPPPISGGTLSIAADGSRAVAANPDLDVVYVVGIAAANVTRIALPARSEPGRVVLDETGHAHVVLRNADKLARLDLDTGKLNLSQPLCRYPRGLAVDRLRHVLWLSCADGALIELDPATYAVLTQHQVERDLRDVMVSADGTRHVSQLRSAHLLELDSEGQVRARVSPPQWLYPSADDLGNVRSHATSATLAYRTVGTPDGAIWMLHQRARDDSLDLKHGYSDAVSCGPVARPALTRFDASGQVSHNLHLSAPAALGVDLAISPDTAWLAMALPGAYAADGFSVRVHSIAQLLSEPPPASLVTARGAGPDQQVELDCRNFDGYLLAGESQAVAVAFDAAGLLYVQNRFPARLDILRLVGTNAPAQPGGVASVQRIGEIPLDTDDRRDRGHELFHASIGADGLSCASCHGEAQGDGHVWVYKDAPHLTVDLRGGLLTTYPLGWDGSAPDFYALAYEELSTRMGATLSRDGADAMASWLHTRPALQLPAADALCAMRGKALFEAELGCSTCHAGEAFTANHTVDIGTGARMQVPGLRGLGLRTPLLHDGCAKTLAEVFEPKCFGGDAHRVVSLQGPEQRRDLLEYLGSL